MSNAFKFLNLQNSLKGRAAAALGEWALTDANYNEAWERLKQLFERKYHTSHELLWKFNNLPTLERASGFMLQKFSNVTHEVLRQLRAMNHPVEHYDLIFVHALHDKLDPETRKAWELYRKSETPTITDMLTFLDWQAKASVGAQFKEHKEQKDNRKRPFDKSDYKNNGKRPKTDDAKPNDTDKRMEQSTCAICKEKHFVHRCPKFLKLNLVERRKSVREHKLCHNCLKSSHFSKDCLARACNRCNVKHNSLLCNENPQNKSFNVAQNVQGNKTRGNKQI